MSVGIKSKADSIIRKDRNQMAGLIVGLIAFGIVLIVIYKDEKRDNAKREEQKNRDE
jgi:hypothetical protein